MTIRSLLHPALPAVLLLLAPPAASFAKDEKPVRVAVFPVANASEEVGAGRIMEDILKVELKKIDASRATFIWPADVERLLSAVSEESRIDRINDRYSTYTTVDSTAAQGLDSLLMVDAILVVKVGEWENHRVPVVGAGQSSTTVGLSFALYDPSTFRLVWTKSPREQRFAAEIDPSSSNVSYDETGVIQRKSDNAPPRYETVAADLVRESFKKFPRD